MPGDHTLICFTLTIARTPLSGWCCFTQLILVFICMFIQVVSIFPRSASLPINITYTLLWSLPSTIRTNNQELTPYSSLSILQKEKKKKWSLLCYFSITEFRNRIKCTRIQPHQKKLRVLEVENNKTVLFKRKNLILYIKGHCLNLKN